ncbi:MAG: hypothetical protein B6241_06500 [Spirochaetaceae bacterium 4572_59]|nr:MAG: hypothetical protein B6241_06500 [Spirochaetaceae bacterium 4572_59]
MYRTLTVTAGKLFALIVFFLCPFSAFSLDFAILNRDEIIFQEILIETNDSENNYYFNFGITGLEPGARHNIHISSTEDILFCSFYLFGISNENYAIENVAIEQNSIVYILPEHYQEEMDVYHDVDNPDAVYGASHFDRSDYFLVDEETPENQYRTELELFNYTNSSIFRIYCMNEDVLEAGSYEKDIENLLDGRVLSPQDSITLELILIPEESYSLQLRGADGVQFEKKISTSSGNDFLVFYDSDRVTAWENRHLQIINNTLEELKEVFLIDRKSGKRVELLEGKILKPESGFEYLLEDQMAICDIVIKTASNRKSYIFDWNILENQVILISDE